MLELSPTPSPPPSALMLCDRLIGLAQEAERAGFSVTAEHLLHLVDALFEEASVVKGVRHLLPA